MGLGLHENKYSDEVFNTLSTLSTGGEITYFVVVREKAPNVQDTYKGTFISELIYILYNGNNLLFYELNLW